MTSDTELGVFPALSREEFAKRVDRAIAYVRNEV
jgi:hypothetical protein